VRGHVFHHGLLAFALCFVAACESSSEDEPEHSHAVAPSVPTQPPIGSWVRVDQQKLYMTPSARERLQVDSREPYRLAEVLGYPSDRFVHLRSLAVRPELLCGTRSGSDPNFELQFFAPLNALQPVLNRPKVVEFEDGTRLELMPGVPVSMSEAGAEAEAKLQIGDVEFIVPVSPDEVRNWLPVPQNLILGIPMQWSRDRPLHYGERSVSSFKAPFVFARARQKLDDGAELLTFADACGRYTLRAEPGPPVFESKPPSHGDPIIAKPNPPDRCIKWTTEHHAVLTWATTDRAAGWISSSIEVPTNAREHGGRVCFTAVELSVCLPSDKIEMEERPGCRDAAPIELSPLASADEE
jgi:hypothetical protein